MLTAPRAAEIARRNLSSITYPTDGKIVIALSGGSDSTALLALAREVFSEQGRTERLLAVTVDHGLRAESGAEALRAGRLCASLGVTHVIRRWEGQKPVNGLQAAAREVRYRLLAEEAAGGIVLTGHTLDDQLETVAMRRERGTGRGLSGIAPATLYRGATWFARPLIARRRAELREHLSALGLSWTEDPSNRDPRFERVRVRQRIASGAPGGTEPDDIAVRTAFAERRAESAQAARVLSDERVWTFDAAMREAAFRPHETDAGPGSALALAMVMAWTGQRANLAPQGIVARALAFCEEAGSGKAMTASGCLLEKSGERVKIAREARNRRDEGYGYDHLLPSPDFEAARTLAGRAEGRVLPVPPVSGYPD